MSIKVKNEVDICEIDGEPTKVGGNRTLVVKECFNNSRRVTLVFGGKSITVRAEDLRAAITNATNTGSV